MQNVIELGFSPDITQQQAQIVAALKDVYDAASKLQDVRIELKLGSGFVDLRNAVTEINALYAQITKAIQDYTDVLKSQAQAQQQAAQSTQQATQATQQQTQTTQQASAAAQQAAKSASELNAQYLNITNSLRDNIAQLMRTRDELAANKAAQDSLKATLEAQGVATRQQSANLLDLQTKQQLLTQSIREQLQVINAQAKDAIAAEGSYNQLNATLLTLEKTWKSLSATEANSPMGKQLLTDIATTREQLKQMDAQMGNYQRNVGNYGGAISGIFGQTFSRTVHAATEALLGMQRGVNALAVDLPNLIQHTRDYVTTEKEASAARGESVTTLQLLARALSIETIAIQLGVMALVRYGPEFIHYIANATKGVDATKDFADAQKQVAKETDSAKSDVEAYKNLLHQLNSELEDAHKKSAEEAGQIQLLNSQITDGKLPMNNRLDAYYKLVDLYPEVLGNISKEQALAGGLSDIINKQLIPALNAQAVAQAYSAQIADLAAKKQDELYKQQTLKTAAVNAKIYADQLGDLAVKNSTNERTQDAWTNAIKSSDDATKKYANSMTAVKLLDDQIAQKVKQQKGAYDELSKSVLGNSVSQKQLLQDELKAEQARLDLLTKQDAGYQKQHDLVESLKKQLKAYDPDPNASDKAAKLAQRQEDANQKALYDIDKNYSDLKTKLADDTAKYTAQSQDDSLQKQLDVAQTNYQVQLSAIQKSVDDYRKTEQEKVDTAKVTAAQREQLQAELNKKLADLQTQAGEASVAVTQSYEQRVHNIHQKFNNDEEVVQDQLNAAMLHLYGEDNEAAINAVNQKYDRMRAALQQKGELTNELAAQIAQAQQDEIAIIEAKGSSDRLNALTRAYDEEQTELLKEYNSGKISYEQYQQELVAIQQKYSQQSLEIAIRATEAQIAATTDPKLKSALEDQLAKLNLAYQQSYEKQDQMRKRASDEARNQWEKDAQVAIQSIQSIVDNGYQAQIQAIQDLQQTQDDQFQQEITNVQNSTLSQEQKTARVNQLTAEQSAADKKAQQETKKLQHDQAVFDKEMNVAQILMNTAVGIMKAYAQLGVFATPVAIAIGVEGAIELAAAASAPIPAYATGTDDHPGGLAIVGEGKYKEVAITPDGKTSLFDKATLVDLPKHTSVIPLTPEIQMAPFNERMDSLNELTLIYDNMKRREGWEIAAWQVRQWKQMFEGQKGRTKIINQTVMDFGWNKYVNEKILFIKN